MPERAFLGCGYFCCFDGGGEERESNTIAHLPHAGVELLVVCREVEVAQLVEDSLPNAFQREEGEVAEGSAITQGGWDWLHGRERANAKR